ncbi:sugar nucleotide-binding protein [Glutamicibacter sp. BW77]|uniref:sugar nucleotide-binding protein n=1 Tax=Glutamicibacter sp. BW77 TaxID=2024402 RepID=UPI001F0A4F69|nr:sugar nucleotide-binding protein [Glutamicibacter sp. BW77]
MYGPSKAAGELRALAAPNLSLIRSSLVVGCGANFVTTMKNLAQNRVDLTAVDDQIGQLSFADDLAEAILHLLGTRAPARTDSFQTSGVPLSWFQIALRVFELSDEDSKSVVFTNTKDFAKSWEALALRPW